MVGELHVAIDSTDIRNGLGNEETTAAWLYNNWLQWDNARSPTKMLWDETDRYLEATDTTSTTNTEGDYDHKTHRPKLTQIYDNLMANYKPGLIPNRNWINWVGEDEDAVNKANRAIMESYLRTKHRLSNFSEVVDELLDDWIRTGNAFCGVQYANQFHMMHDGNVKQGYKGPRTYRIDPRDIVMNPTATSFQSAPKIVRHAYTMGSLHRKAEELTGTEREKFQDIIQIMEDDRKFAFKSGIGDMTLKGPDTKEIEKYMNFTFQGFGNYINYLTSGLVEVLEYYGDIYNTETGEFLKNHHVVVVDRRYVILQKPIDTWNGQPHIYHSGWRKRSNNLWAMGPLDNLVGLQYRINHLENLRADAFDKMVDADIVKIGDIEEAYTDTGAIEYTVTEANGDVKRLAPDTTILNADLQINAIEDAMDLYAGSPREAMGFRTPGEKTKFEVSQLMNAAGRIFQHKLERFETQILEPVLNAEIEVVRQAKEYNDTVEIIAPENGAVLFDQISAEDLHMNGKYIPIGARHYSRQQQLAQDARDMFAMMVQDPEVMEHFPSKKMAQLFEEVMGFDRHGLYQAFGRVFERQEKARYMQTATEQLEDEDDADINEPIEDDVNAEDSPDLFEQGQVQGQ